MARKFLYVIAGLIVLAIVAGFALSIFSDELTRRAFVPTTEYAPQVPLAANAYRDPAMWYVRPGLRFVGERGDPTRYQPPLDCGDEDDDDAPPCPEYEPPAPAQPFAIFFVHPTSYTERDAWNAPLDHPRSRSVALTYLRGMASPFNQAEQIWAPRYRQATLGAFLTTEPEAAMAIDAAYDDVARAFDVFVDEVDPDLPIVLAGHSQGSLHLLRLYREAIAGSPMADRIAAIYAVGWPISIDRDLPAIGALACTAPEQTGCIVSWSSYAEPADPGFILDTYAASTGLDGALREDSAILCSNPLTGGIGGTAPAEANLGTLVPNEALTEGQLVPGAVPARCDERGLLLIGDPPELGPAVLPGNNYHVYDVPLFWANLQADVARRVDAWAS